MNINQQERDKLLNFIGYGNLNAPFWFLGMEEGSGGIQKLHADPKQNAIENEKLLERNIEKRLRFRENIMDLQEAHNNQHLNWEYWKPEITRFPSVWVYMARFVRALGNEQASDWWDTEKAKVYIRTKLGVVHSASETFLTELLPLPKRSAKDWPNLYKVLMGYSRRQDYESEELRPRIKTLSQIIAEKKPEYLLCYGESNYDSYKKIIEVASEQWKTIPETRFEIAYTNDTKVILSPFMGNGRVGYKSFSMLIAYMKTLDNC